MPDARPLDISIFDAPPPGEEGVDAAGSPPAPAPSLREIPVVLTLSPARAPVAPGGEEVRFFRLAPKPPGPVVLSL